MRDERQRAGAILGRLEVGTLTPFYWFLASLVVALWVSWLPEDPTLGLDARRALFILVFAAGLWITEAIPAFAVALVVIGLQIVLLASERGGGHEWTLFIEPWSSPVIWLFLGGFVLAASAAKSGLDRWLSGWVLGLCGSDPRMVLVGAMGATFVFSMFISNTATTAMMIAVMLPVIASLSADNPYRNALLLGVPFAANIGGMGTIIGSPPNAIAAGELSALDPVDFLEWMFLGLPPALLLGAVIGLYLLWRYPSSEAEIDVTHLARDSDASLMPLWQRVLIMVVFTMTVGLWLASPVHGVPTAVVSFVPITLLTMFRVIAIDDIRGLPWDVLLLVAGGLSLGVGLAETGLAGWLVTLLPVDDLGPIAVVLSLAYLCSALSNFMSNTAASNIIVPLAIAFGTNAEAHYAVPVALAASSAMCLPVSTPPNALAFAQGDLEAGDFVPGGLLAGVLAAPVVVAWCWAVL